MKHAGKYGCRAQTSADTVFAEAELLVRGEIVICQSDVLHTLNRDTVSLLQGRYYEMNYCPDRDLMFFLICSPGRYSQVGHKYVHLS